MPHPSNRPDDSRRSGVSPDRARDPRPHPANRLRRAIDAVTETFCAATPSREAVRDAAVRYGSAARALALAPEDMAAALHAQLRRCTARHSAALRAELEASVGWWAIHGYHRAD